MSLASFWNPGRFTRGFGAVGLGYTIVKNRHIGLDVASTGDIPALVAGVVSQVASTTQMGKCVEIDTGRSDGRYWSYCHVANVDLPARGTQIGRGDRVGRVARGPKTLPMSHPEFPGRSWGGPHVHLVVSNIRGAAWTYPPARRLSDFYDPDPLVRSILANPASLNLTPFGDDFMSALSDAQQAQIYDALVKHGPSGDYYTPDAIINILRDEIGKAVAVIALGGIRYPGTNWNAFETLTNVSREDGGREGVAVDGVEFANTLAPILAPMLSENLGTLSDETVDSLVTKLLDEQSKRLAS